MLQGKVESVVVGIVNSEVTLRLDSGMAVYAIITNESVQTLNLAPGKVASALIKSSWVILTSADETTATLNEPFASPPEWCSACPPAPV